MKLSTKAVGLVLAAAVIYACGGSDAGTVGNQFTKTWNVQGVNNDSLPVHIVRNAEEPNPNTNRVPANGKLNLGTLQFGYDTDTTTRQTNYSAFRNGVQLATTSVFIQKEQAQQAEDWFIVTYSPTGGGPNGTEPRLSWTRANDPQ